MCLDIYLGIRNFIIHRTPIINGSCPSVLLQRCSRSLSSWRATRYRRISSTTGAASLNEPKNNNRTANSACRLIIRVFWYMTPVGKVAADVPMDFRAFIFQCRRQNLCKLSPCDTASRRQCHCPVPEASQHSTRLLPATQVRSDRAALLVVVVRRKTKHQKCFPFNKHYASTYRSD